MEEMALIVGAYLAAGLAIALGRRAVFRRNFEVSGQQGYIDVDAKTHCGVATSALAWVMFSGEKYGCSGPLMQLRSVGDCNLYEAVYMEEFYGQSPLWYNGFVTIFWPVTVAANAFALVWLVFIAGVDFSLYFGRSLKSLTRRMHNLSVLA